MDGNIVVWDWKRSSNVATIEEVRNEDTYQPVYFTKQNGDTRGLIFLEDDGNLLQCDLTTNKIIKQMIIPNCEEGNWKLHVDKSDTTTKAYVYDHNRATIMCFDTSFSIDPMQQV